jgi:hypothetical protein
MLYFYGINLTVEIAQDLFRILADYRIRHLVNIVAMHINTSVSSITTINSPIDRVKYSKYNSYLLNKIKGDEVIKKLPSLLTKST